MRMRVTDSFVSIKLKHTLLNSHWVNSSLCLSASYSFLSGLRKQCCSVAGIHRTQQWYMRLGDRKGALGFMHINDGSDVKQWSELKVNSK